jgi:cyclophilin family peptidyl-prolyl cis-trans isomerase
MRHPRAALTALTLGVLWCDPIRAQSIRLPAVSERQVLQAEHGRRDEDAKLLVDALQGSDPRIQRLAARALGRFERPALAAPLILMVTASDALVRAEAVNALGQSGVAYPYHELLERERNGFVRGVIYETIGRVRPTPDGAEAVLARGLAEAGIDVRAGAARGLESLLRRTARTARPAESTLVALRRAAVDRARTPVAAEMRENALLALSAASDRDSATVAVALRDRSAQVRRVASSLARRWTDDPSYIVRLQALRYAGSCERFIAATRDSNEHVVLAAIDTLGGRACDPGVLVRQADAGRTWRMKAHAIVSLARIAPDSARARVRALASSRAWQARTYAAAAARVLRDSATLRRLAADAEPNVVIAAMTASDEALRALAQNHSGLILAAVDLLAGDPPRSTPLPVRTVDAMVGALDRLTGMAQVTTRDPRMKLLAALAKGGDSARVLPVVRRLLSDMDPAVAASAADIATTMSGSPHRAITVRYEAAPLPGEAFMNGLRGATAQLTVRGVGTIELALLPDDAPVTVATFAELAERGTFNGLTFHRIVPNFVLQGGSPGADEYDALTTWFMRDEVGLARNARGTFGISTRGRDTGDGQIYINLIDNFRLDHDYTVFARTLRGLDVIDRIQEGDVIASIRIIRSRNR